MRIRKHSVLLGLSLLTSSAIADISGNVYTDFNLNGNKDATDTVVPGLTVNAFCADGSTPSTSTDASGNYKLAIVTPNDTCRVELDISSRNWLTAGSNATGDATLVSTVADGTTHNISVSSPTSYCQANPKVVIATLPGGQTPDPLTFGSLFTLPTPTIGLFNKDFSIRTQITPLSDTGGIWGIAWHKRDKIVFASAAIHRYVPLKNNNAGAIYKIDPNTSAVSLFATVPNVGYSLTNRDMSPNQDLTAVPLVGRKGLGGLGITADSKFLYTINLNTKELVKIDSADGSIISTVAIPNPYGGDCPAADVRPWAVKVQGDDIYIGSVCETKIEAGVGAAIQKYNGAMITVAAKTNTLLYLKPKAFGPAGNVTHRRYQNVNWKDDAYNHSPLLADIEFDNEGNMVLGYADRGAMTRNVGSQSNGSFGNSFGDIRKMCRNIDGSFTDESTAAAPTDCASHIQTYGANNSDTYYEFYIGDNFSEGGVEKHPETASGSLAMRPGDPTIYVGMVDATDYFEAGSLGLYDNVTGDKIAGQALIDTDKNGERLVYGSKAGGLGDIEVLCDTAPIEVGNLVWEDTNNNGIQDPAEPVIPNVPVKLSCEGADFGTTTTDSKGHFYFGGMTDANLINGKTITAEQNCKLTIAQADVGGREPSTTDVNNNADDRHDNDATKVGTDNVISFKTSVENDHKLDFGIKNATVKIGNHVWIEDDNDGDATSGTITSVVGATVTATCAGTDYTGVTDNAGLYSIDVPANSSCTVKVATPANTVPSTGSNDNTADNSAGENDKTHDGSGTTVAVGTTDDLTLDFGFYKAPAATTVKIGDRVWIEDDNDGDAGTGTITAVVGVTVTASCAGTDYTGVTDNAGLYSIDVPKNTNCIVKVATPANTVPSTGSNDSTAGENDKTHDGSGTTVAVGTTDDLTLDFGFYKATTVKIGDHVWIEDDNDGDAGTGTITAVVGVTVTASCAGTDYTGVTDNAGLYSIDVPKNTNCTVKVATPANTVPSTGSNDNTAGENDKTHDGSGTTVAVGTTDDLTLDFGFYKATTVKIGDRVWIEDDNDGDAATGATIPVVGVTVTAACAGTDYTAVTDNAGNYLIDVPVNTNCTVKVATPANTTPSAGSNDNTAGENDKTHDGSGTTVAVGTTDDLTLDFGFFRATKVKIGNHVWIEDDNDGDAGTGTITPVVGTTVTASCAGTDYTGITDNAGLYSIDVPVNTDCTVSVATPANTKPATGSTDNTAGENDKTHDGAGTTVTVGTVDDMTLDFGFKSLVKIGNHVWIEDDNDGDATTGNITPVAGTTVTAACAGKTYTGVTNAAGNYEIVVPTNSICTVSVATPANTKPATGSTDNTAGENDKTHDGAGTTVTVGTVDDMTLDFGFKSLVKIGNRVWIEDDNDGDATTGNTTPIVGTTVTAACDGTNYTGVTDNTGNYEIVVPTNTSCTVSVATPANTQPAAGSDDNTAGENDKTHDGSGTTVAVGTTDDMTLDFGFKSLVKIGNHVWIEDDNDGDATTGTITPVIGATVTAACAGTNYSSVTDNSGHYLIVVPTNTSCSLSIATPTDTVPSKGSDDNTAGENDKTHNGAATTVNVGTVDDLTIDFGFVPSVKIGNRIWIEDDNDGDATTGNIVVPPTGTVVIATASDGTQYKTSTDADGKYKINVPANDTYWVTVELAKAATAGSFDDNVSDTTSENDRTHNGFGRGTKVLVGSEDNMSIDFGFTPEPLLVARPSYVLIGDRIWIEDDNDGDASTGKITKPAAGIVVTATSTNGTQYTGVTNTNGDYRIEVPENDTYVVTSAAPVGTCAALHCNDEGDINVSDISTENNLTHDSVHGTTVTVGTEDNLTVDFGFCPVTVTTGVSRGGGSFSYPMLLLIGLLSLVSLRRRMALKPVSDQQ